MNRFVKYWWIQPFGFIACIIATFVAAINDSPLSILTEVLAILLGFSQVITAVWILYKKRFKRFFAVSIGGLLSLGGLALFCFGVVVTPLFSEEKELWERNIRSPATQNRVYLRSSKALYVQ